MDLISFVCFLNVVERQNERYERSRKVATKVGTCTPTTAKNTEAVQLPSPPPLRCTKLAETKR